MNVDRYIAAMTTDTRMRRILTKAARVDDTPDSRCVMKAWLGSEITALIKVKAPLLTRAAQAFVRTKEPKSIYRGLQLYIWLNEKIPDNQDRATLILLGMQQYLEAEAKADAAREMVTFLAVQ